MVLILALSDQLPTRKERAAQKQAYGAEWARQSRNQKAFKDRQLHPDVAPEEAFTTQAGEDSKVDLGRQWGDFLNGAPYRRGGGVALRGHGKGKIV